MAECVEKCTADPNFAVICSFLERFAKPCGISHPNFLELQEMLENNESVPQPLVDLHVKLLRKARKSVSVERWERAVVKFCHMHAGSEFIEDGWELERLGYKNFRLDGKLRVLKLLLEHQFDLNNKFKAEVNRLSSSDLRLQPFGRDKVGQNYWLQQDEFCNLNVYREDADNETWQVVASDRESLVQLIGQLSGGNLGAVFNSDDSNSHEGIDTGQVAEENQVEKKPEAETVIEDASKVVGDSKSDRIVKEESNVDEDEDGAGKKSMETETKKYLPQTMSVNQTWSKDEVVKRSEKKPQKLENIESVKVEVKEMESKASETENVKDKRQADDPKDERESKRIKIDDSEVSQAIEDPTLLVVGEGSGKDCEWGNFTESDVGEAIEEPVIYFAGHGSGQECDMSNPKNSDETEKSETLTDNNSKSLNSKCEGDSVVNTNGTNENASAISDSKPKEDVDDSELDFLKTGFYFGPGTLQAKDRIPMGSPEAKPPAEQEVSELNPTSNEEPPSVSKDNTVVNTNLNVNNTPIPVCTSIEENVETNSAPALGTNSPSPAEELKSNISSEPNETSPTHVEVDESSVVASPQLPEPIICSSASEAVCNQEVSSLASGSEVVSDINQEPAESAIVSDSRQKSTLSVIASDVNQEPSICAIETDTIQEPAISAVESDSKPEPNVSPIESDANLEPAQSPLPHQPNTSQDVLSNSSINLLDMKTDNPCLETHSMEVKPPELHFEDPVIPETMKNLVVQASEEIQTPVNVEASNIPVETEPLSREESSNPTQEEAHAEEEKGTSVEMPEAASIPNASVDTTQEALSIAAESENVNQDPSSGCSPATESSSSKPPVLTEPETSLISAPELKMEELEPLSKALEPADQTTAVGEAPPKIVASTESVRNMSPNTVKPENETAAPEAGDTDEPSPDTVKPENETAAPEAGDTDEPSPDTVEPENKTAAPEAGGTDEPSPDTVKPENKTAAPEAGDTDEQLGSETASEEMCVTGSEVEAVILPESASVTGSQADGANKQSSDIVTVPEAASGTEKQNATGTDPVEIIAGVTATEAKAALNDPVVPDLPNAPQFSEEAPVPSVTAPRAISPDLSSQIVVKPSTVDASQVLLTSERVLEPVISASGNLDVLPLPAAPSSDHLEAASTLTPSMIDTLPQSSSASSDPLELAGILTPGTTDVSQLPSATSSDQPELAGIVASGTTDLIPQPSALTSEHVEPAGTIAPKTLPDPASAAPSSSHLEAAGTVLLKTLPDPAPAAPSSAHLEAAGTVVQKTLPDPAPAVISSDPLEPPDSSIETLDDDPPAITTLEDAMRQMEEAGAPVRLDDSEEDDDDDDDDDGPAEQPEDVHEDEEEEKSFFVFEGSTGGWKHATTGQMEEDQKEDMYPELDQLPVEAEVAEGKPDKGIQDRLKERVKIIPRRATRASRSSGLYEAEGSEEGDESKEDPLALSGDEVKPAKGLKRKIEDSTDPSENAADRTTDASSDLDNTTEETCTGEGDDEGEPFAKAPRRGGWRGRRGRGRRGWRGRGRGGRWGASSRPAPSEDQTTTEAEGEGDAEAEAEGADPEGTDPDRTKNEAEEAASSPDKTPKKPRKSRMLAELEVNMSTDKIEESEDSGRGVRTSRRIAQIRLKEQAEKRDYEEAEVSLRDRLRMEKDAKKAAKLQKRLEKEMAAAEDSDSDDDIKEKKKKHKKEKKPNFNPGTNVWNQTSSGSSSGSESVEEEMHEASDDDAPYVVKSDHEFSPESDVNDDDYAPTRRARTARRDKDAEAEAEEEYPCKKCAKSDQPEWMLLCDKCDAGWHCSCLRPALLQIPEGDWFCPPCQHTQLISNLQEHLKSYDLDAKRLASEEARRQHLLFIDVSVQNILPDEEEVVKKKKKKKLKIKHRERVRGKRRRCQVIASDKESLSGLDDTDDEVDNDDKNDPDADDGSDGSTGSADSSSSGTPTSSSSSSSSSASEKSSDEDEPTYKLRQRRQTNVNYRFSEYDDLIKSAIQDGIEDEVAEKVAVEEEEPVPAIIPEKTVKSVGKRLEGEDEEDEEEKDEDEDDSDEVNKKPQRRGKYLTDEEEEDEPAKEKDEDDDDDEEEEDEEEEEEGFVPPVVKKSVPKGKRKKRSLTALEFSSTSSDPESDEDFKGSSAADDDDDDAESYGSDSDDSVVLSRRKGAATRSGRYSNRMTRWDREFIDDSSDESDDSDAPKRKKKRKSTERAKRAPPKKAPPKGKRGKRKVNKSDSDKEVRIKKSKAKAPAKREQSGSDSDAPAPRRTRGRRMDYREAVISSEEEEGKEKKGKGKTTEAAKGGKKLEGTLAAESTEVTVTKEKPRTHPRIKVTPLRNVAAGPAGTPGPAAGAAAAPVVAGMAIPSSTAAVTITASTKKGNGVNSPPAVPVQMKGQTPTRIVAPGITPNITAVPINPDTKAPLSASRSLKELQQLVTPKSDMESPGLGTSSSPASTAQGPSQLQGQGPLGPMATQGPQGPSMQMPQHVHPAGHPAGPPTSYPSPASGPLMAMQALAGESPYPPSPYPQPQYYHQGPPGPPGPPGAQGPPPHHGGPPPHAPYLPTPHHASHHGQSNASQHHQTMVQHLGGHHPHHPHLGPQHQPQHHHGGPPPPHHGGPPALHHGPPPPHHLMQGHHGGGPHLSPHHLHHAPHQMALPPHHLNPHNPYGPPPPSQAQALTQLPPQVPSPGAQQPPTQPAPPTAPTQPEEGRSEFGGLVSYFSSQHDDMDG